MNSGSEFSRKAVSSKLGIGERQVQRYLKIAAKHLTLFADFIDEDTETLTGMPIETESQIEELKMVRKVVLKYRNTKNKDKLIALELEKINHQRSTTNVDR